MTCAPFLYTPNDPAAVIARARDDAFFARRQRATYRVRPLFEGESPLAEGMRERGFRAYAIVIDHARAGDKRARFGRGVYPVIVPGGLPDAREHLAREATRWAKWFREHATTPPPPPGQGVIVEGRA